MITLAGRWSNFARCASGVGEEGKKWWEAVDILKK